jgi:hypothetical protein
MNRELAESKESGAEEQQFAALPSAPVTVSLDPKDYFYPTTMTSLSSWSAKYEQKIAESTFVRASLFGNHHGTVIDPADSVDPSSSFECFAFDTLPEKTSSKSSQKSTTTARSSPRTTASSKNLRSSAGAIKAATALLATPEDEEGPEMLVTASSGLLGLIDSEMFGSDGPTLKSNLSLKSNIVKLKRKSLSLNLDHEATAACINNRAGLSTENLAKKVATGPQPSNSCESSQSPCNVTLTGLDMNLRAC